MKSEFEATGSKLKKDNMLPYLKGGEKISPRGVGKDPETSLYGTLGSDA